MSKRSKKFCSNEFKHKEQHIWNRGKTKYDSEVIMKSSKRMKGNSLSKYRKKHKTNELFLPTLNINLTYDSQLEKEWLLQIDKDNRVKMIIDCQFSIPYKDEFGKERDYYPDN